MPVQTQILHRRDTAANWTSTNPVLSSGEMGFETDTGKFKIGNGSTAWAALAYSAGATAVTYLFNATSGQTTFSGADANGLTLAYTVGAEQVYLNGVLQVRGSDYTATNGTSIVLTSGALTSDVLNVIAYSAMTITDTYTQAQADAKFFQNATSYLAGKNFIINGGFDFFQRGSLSTTSGGYGLDRWYQVSSGSGAAVTMTQQTTGVPNGSRYCARVTTAASAGYGNLYQWIETANVAGLWGKTVNVSLKLRRNSAFAGTLSVSLAKSATVDAGNGATWTTLASQTVTNAQLPTGTTSADWYTVSFTASVPNDGTANGLQLSIQQSQVETSAYWEIAQVQLEAGPVATQFARAGGTIAGELAACQRYYWRANSAGAAYTIFALGYTDNTTSALIMAPVPSYMRVFPTSIDYANLAFQEAQGGIFTFTGISLNGGSGATAPNNNIQFQITGASGMTTGRPGRLLSNGVTNGHLGFSAEL